MTGFEAFLAIYMGLLAPLLIGLMSARFRRLEVEISSLRAEISALRTEFRHELRQEIAGLRTELRAEIAALRAEVRAEMAAVRADLTQIALAVGARRPRASER